MDRGGGPNLDFFNASELANLKQLARRPKHFWKDYPLLISLFAFLLSLLTALTSLFVGYKKDIHDQLAELSAAMRTISDLNIRQVEIREKYGGTRNEQQAAALITNQLYTTTLNAADIAFRLGTSATTASIIPVSDSLYHYGLYAKAEDLALLGLRASRSAEDETTALRALGSMKISLRTSASIEEGSQLFTHALDFEKKYGQLRVQGVTEFIKAGIQLQWADALAPIDCSEALKHYSAGAEILNSSGETVDLNRLRSNARQKVTMGIGGVRSCVPTELGLAVR